MPNFPKILHFIWLGDNPIPHKYNKNIEHFIRLNPDYTVMWHRDLKDVPEAWHVWLTDYDKHKHDPHYLRHYSDILRYAVLRKYGGFYFDLDVYPITPCDTFLEVMRDLKRGKMGAFIHMVHTSFMCVASDFNWTRVDGLIEKFKAERSSNPPFTTGTLRTSDFFKFVPTFMRGDPQTFTMRNYKEYFLLQTGRHAGLRYAGAKYGFTGKFTETAHCKSGVNCSLCRHAKYGALWRSRIHETLHTDTIDFTCPVGFKLSAATQDLNSFKITDYGVLGCEKHAVTTPYMPEIKAAPSRPKLPDTIPAERIDKILQRAERVYAELGHTELARQSKLALTQINNSSCTNCARRRVYKALSNAVLSLSDAELNTLISILA